MLMSSLGTSMRFVAIKTADHQAALMLQRTRDLLVHQRSSLISAIRAHFAEFWHRVGLGIRNIDRLPLSSKAKAISGSRRSRLRCSGSWPRSCKMSLRECERSRCVFWLGIAPIRLADAWRAYPASARSLRARSLPPSAIPNSSAPVDTSPLGWGSSRSSDQAEEWNGSVEYQSEATATSAVCSSTAHGPSSAGASGYRGRQRLGSSGCLSVRPSMS